MKPVISFQSAVYFTVLKFEFIIRALTNSQKVELVRKKIHTIGGVDWHLPNRKLTYLRSAFLLFDAAIFSLEALKQIILELIVLRIFSLLLVEYTISRLCTQRRSVP